jgi:hypothetical protein
VRPGITRGVEEDHRIIGQGVGVKPETPEPSHLSFSRKLRENGSADVQSGVDLAIQSPAALGTFEHLAHPASAFDFATSRAGLARISWIDFDDRYSSLLRLILNLAMQFALRPGGQATAQALIPPASFRQTKILEGDRSSSAGGKFD